MIVKNESCLYCGEKMESKTAKKKFCSNLHRLYYHRELKRGSLVKVNNLTAPNTEIKPVTPIKSNYAIDTTKTVEAIPVFKNAVEKIIWEQRQKILNNKKK